MKNYCIYYFFYQKKEHPLIQQMYSGKGPAHYGVSSTQLQQKVFGLDTRHQISNNVEIRIR
jgi:hypothetical protein